MNLDQEAARRALEDARGTIEYVPFWEDYEGDNPLCPSIMFEGRRLRLMRTDRCREVTSSAWSKDHGDPIDFFLNKMLRHGHGAYVDDRIFAVFDAFSDG